MVDFNEINGKLPELTADEIDTHRQAALDEFNEIKDAEASEENVARMSEIADFVSALTEESKAREARQAELAAEAEAATARMAELTAKPVEEDDKDDEDAPVEDVVVEDEVAPVDEEVVVPVDEDDEDEDKKKKDLKPEFATEDESKDKDKEDVKAEDEDKKDEDKDKLFSAEESVAEVEASAETEVNAEAQADAETFANEDNQDSEESVEADFATNTEENNVATTPDELSVQDAPESKSAGLGVTITAGADIPGYGLGAELSNLNDVAKAFDKRLHAIGRNGSGNGEQHTVATFSTEFPVDRQLSSSNFGLNESRMDEVASPEAVIAAGGICAPLPIDEEIITYGSTARPVRDALPRFNAERGGVIYLTPPSIADIKGAVSVWTLADDYAAIGVEVPKDLTEAGVASAQAQTSLYPKAIAGTTTDVTGPVKPAIRISCGSEVRAYVDAIPSIFTIGNMQARAWPELIEKHLELALVWQARFAETRLLTRLGNLSTKVHTVGKYGLTRDFLDALSVTVAAFRSRNRLDGDFKFRAILPIWFREAIRADMRRQLPGDGQDVTFNLSDSTIDSWIAASGVNVTWHLDGEDGQVLADQLNAPKLTGTTWTPGEEAKAVTFPTEVVWYLFPEGGFVFLDGGTLDLGIVRDSTLNSKNDYQVFIETFEGLIKRSPEAFRVRTDLKLLGATTGTIDPEPTPGK